MTARAQTVGPLRVRRKFLPLVLTFALSALPVEAHSPFRQMGEFYEGMAHPLLHVEHAAVLVVMALFAGQVGVPRARWHLGWVLVASALSWAACVVFHWGLGDGRLHLAALTLGGAAIALAWSPPWRLHFLYSVLATGVLVSGNAAEWDGTSPVLRGAGTVLAMSFATLLLSAAAVKVPQYPAWPNIAMRAVGSWLAALGLMLLALRI